MPVNVIMRASYCRASIFMRQKFISLKILVHIKFSAVKAVFPNVLKPPSVLSPTKFSQ